MNATGSTRRFSAYAAAALLPALLSIACSPQAPTVIREFELEHFEGTGDENSLRYDVDVTELGVVPQEAVRYTFECVRHPDGTSVLTITQGEEVVATATRAPDGSVTLETASGLLLERASGPIPVTAAHQSALSLMEWALLDATIFASYDMPAGLEDLRGWRDGLVLVDSLDAIVDEEAEEYGSEINPLWHETPTVYRFFQGAFTARITVICIPSVVSSW